MKCSQLGLGLTLITNAAPNFLRIDIFVGVQLYGFGQENICLLRIGWIRNTAIGNRADRGTLGFIKMADTLRAPLIGDDIDIIAVDM